MQSSQNNGNRDLLKPPKDLIDVSVGSGSWQIIVTLMLSFIVFIHLLNTGNETLLRPPSWWCKMPDFIEDWTDVQWILYSHYKDSCIELCDSVAWSTEMLADGYFQGCQIYDIDYESLRGLEYSQRPMIDTNKTIPCPFGVHYSTKSGRSLAEKYQRGCWNGTVVSSLWLSSSTFGRIAGYIVFGVLTDWIGRKSVLSIACGTTPITALIVAISPNYPMFLVASIIHGFFHGGFAACMILVLEVSTNSWRTGLVAITCGSFALGIGLTPVINSVFESYDQMIVFINLLCVVMYVSSRFLPESPAWLFCIRDGKRLEKEVRKAAEFNQRESKPTFRLIHINHIDERHRMPEQMPAIWDIVFHPEVTCQLITLIYLTSLFGLMFGSAYYSILSNIAKSQLAATLIAASTTIGMLVGQFCILLMGHRKTLRISITLVFISSFVLMIKLHDLKPSIIGPTTTLILLKVSLVSLSYGILLNYNTRTFPTLLRGTVSGIFHSTWAIFVWAGNHDYVKFPRATILLVISFFIAALFSLNLRKLHHRELPDTMQDCTRFRIYPKPKRWEMTEIAEDSPAERTSYITIEKPSHYLDRSSKIETRISGKGRTSRVPRKTQTS